jgi:hypothetical protein
MERLNMMSVAWEKVAVLGKVGFFTDWRIDRNSIPDGWYFYEVRHADNDWCEPVEVALGVLVNFWGTLITKEPLLPEEVASIDDAYVYIDSEKDWKYLQGFAFAVEGS